MAIIHLELTPPRQVPRPDEEELLGDLGDDEKQAAVVRQALKEVRRATVLQ